MKIFSMIVVLPLEKHFSGFELPLFVPAELVFKGGLQVTCSIGSERVGVLIVEQPGDAIFQGTLPPFALHEPILRLKFEVISHYSGDGRELGVCIRIHFPSGCLNAREYSASGQRAHPSPFASYRRAT
jgi:hypothetical protein